MTRTGRAQRDTTHERIAGDAEIKSSSNRAFGLTFAAVFLIIACWPLLGLRPLRWWALGVAILFLAAAVVAPRMLSPLNRLWFVIGLALHAVVSTVVMGLVFFTTLTPIAVLMRALGKDPLRLKREPGAATYWIDRQPPGPAAETMTRQF